MRASSLSTLLAPGFCIAATDYPATHPTDATLSAFWMQPYYTLAGLVLASSVITLLFARLRLRNRQPDKARGATINDQDASERRAIDRALRESEKRFRDTFEHAAVGIAHVGLNGRWLRLNKKLCDILGYSREELQAVTFQDITHPEDVATDLSLVHQCLTGEIDDYGMQKRYLRKDGSLVWAQLTVALVRREDGEPDYFISVIEDITQRKHDQAALEQANSLYQGLIENMRDGVAIYDAVDDGADFVFASFNPAAARSARLSTDQVIGRNGYQFFDPAVGTLGSSRKDWAARIGQALQDDELCLVYQPIVNMRDGGVAGMEALVRWRHPDRGLLLPSAFLPIIEDTELIRALDRWVLQRAIADLADWLEHGLSPRLHVNLSAHSLLADDFIDGLQAIFDNTPSVTGDQISLEILETAALEDLEAVTGVIRRCNDLGVRFALDDFGTGYSSLTYFRHLPADTLKIDQSFVRDMLRDHGDLRIVESVIGMARAFDRTVIAEGVESEEHGTMLLRFGCDLGQGYGIARPMPSEQVAQWLQDYQHPRQWRSAAARVWRPEDLPLLTMEAEHRGWVDRLILLASDASDDPPMSTDDGSSRFGRWYATDGMRQYGHMDAFKDIDALHQRVHKLGERLLQLRENGDPPNDEAVEQLRMASNALIDRLTMLQNAVIESQGTTEPGPPDSQHQEPLDSADPDWASPT